MVKRVMRRKTVNRRVVRKRVVRKRVVKRKFGGRTLIEGRQHGTSVVRIDRELSARLPGKRISKKGNIYYETRKNRSDRRGKTT